MAFDTAGNIINDVAVELGLLGEDLVDPYASPEPVIVRLRRLLKGVGGDIVRDFDWAALTLTHSYTQVDVATEGFYALPGGFRSLAGIVWNTTTDQEIAGPYSALEWSRITTGAVTLTTPAFYVADSLHVWAGTAGTVSFPYVTNWWHDDGSGDPTGESPTNASDVVFLDRRAVCAGLKCAWLVSTGMPSDGAREEYDRALARAQGSDGGARPIGLAAGSARWRPQWNPPGDDGSWGT